MNSKRKKSARKPKVEALATVESQPTTVGLPLPEAVQKTRFSEASEQAFSNWMKEVFGTEDHELQSQLLNQAAVTVPNLIGRELQSSEYVVAAVHGVRPKDALEGMLAVQLVAAHTMAMECLKRAALPNQIDLGVEVNINRGTKLMRTFASLTEALSRYRGKGEQKMIVEHVHVHKGGQAIVGAVSQSNTQNNTKVRSGADDSQ
jgi:hypothetical protein